MASLEVLQRWDKEDALNWTRGEFEIPNARACGGEIDGEAIYFCGNSLGLLARKARKHMLEELDVWSSSSVTGHFDHPHNRPWKHVDAPLTPLLAKLLGAQEEEVAHTSTLTSNMHNLFISFYKPTKKRWKIVIEQGSFPSDWYAVHSHPRLHDAILSEEQIQSSIIPLSPRPGEVTLRTSDILSTIEKHKDEIAVVWLPLVQYYTGQLFDIPPISQKTHEIGAIFGLDLAHGTGNVEIRLNDWGVDMAVWCTYKYLNAGPAAIGGMYIRTGLSDGGRRLAGWWGNDPSTRFEMQPTFSPTPGAKGYQHSCTPVFSSIPLLATLELIDQVGFSNMRIKGIKLTNTLEELLSTSRFYIPRTPFESSSLSNSASNILPTEGTHPPSGSLKHVSQEEKKVEASKEKEERDTLVKFRILTPPAPWRGTQLSLHITPSGSMPRIFTSMLKRGLVGDERKPDVIRLSPVVLYNTFSEVGRAVKIVEQALEEEEKWQRSNKLNDGGKVVAVEDRDMLGPEP
ncbi:kynureninase [Tremella mesenterica]|uniref:Kynureninase n=1 Tax=Tremella mesenterica TaxID=5217 RepID=A0A4Q1BWI7_TREME|nr:kynureninase [Tremella mesenterica]